MRFRFLRALLWTTALCPTLIASALALPPDTGTGTAHDLREDYDVKRYDLELAVRPSTQTLEGEVDIVAVALVDGLASVRLDLYDLHEVLAVRDGAGNELEFDRGDNGLVARLTERLAKKTEFTITVRYRGKPVGQGFDGFHWVTTEAKRPWINTACQGLGAHYWYPCKASYFHPEDKPEGISMAIVCPADLYGVSNGRLVEVVEGAPDWFDTKGTEYKTYRWRHDYPLETYAASLNVAPYVVVEQELDVPGIGKKVPFIYYVLPENAEKAALQFRQVPELVRIYSEAFGPFPFPDSKFALVETNFWGMEHSTAVAYGSSYPAWCEENGVADPRAKRNRWFDYILIHEVAHEWWGNAVSAEHWGHFWIHEGFGTYAEGVYVEATRDRETADRFFAQKGSNISTRRGRLYRGDKPTSGKAYSGLLYSKGACVLHTLRHYVNDDAIWWKTLRDFNLAYRYGNASTEDFRGVLRANTGREWKRFFDEWVYGEGTPKLGGSVHVEGTTIVVEAINENGTFHVPLDLAWSEGGERRQERVWIDPGRSKLEIECEGKPRDLAIESLVRLLGRHTIEVSDG